MNRRDFAKSLAALGILPAIAPLSTTPAAAAPTYSRYMYGLGAHAARKAGHCSPAMLAKTIGLPLEAAKMMQAQLLRDGILTSSGNALGAAQVMRPHRQGTFRPALDQLKRAAKDTLRDQITDLPNPQPRSDVQHATPPEAPPSAQRPNNDDQSNCN